MSDFNNHFENVLCDCQPSCPSGPVAPVSGAQVLRGHAVPEAGDQLPRARGERRGDGAGPSTGIYDRGRGVGGRNPPRMVFSAQLSAKFL